MRTSAHCAILRVKSPPHLEPWDIQRFLERGVAAKRRENASAPQNGISSQAQQGIPPQGFQNHIPARGRKQHHRHCSRDYYDYFKTISPQGDGNTDTSNLPLRALYFKTISPQGDGNHFNSSLLATGGRISKPYPRKGTETLHREVLFVRKITYFKTISPQGDGNLGCWNG